MSGLMPVLRLNEPPTQVSYPVILIEGSHFHCPAPSPQVSLVNCDLDYQISMFQWRFKAVIQLKLGQNSLTFGCSQNCCQEVSMEVVFQRVRRSRKVKILCVNCTDQSWDFCYPHISRRLSLAAKLVQSFYATELRRAFETPETFQLETDSDTGETHVTPSQFNHANGEEVYWELVEDVLGSSIYDSESKYVVVLCTEQQCHSLNLGKGQVAVVDGGNVLSWPESLSSLEGIHTASGSSYSFKLGSMAHELGHTFSLVHAHRSEGGMMLEGFEQIMSEVLIGRPSGAAPTHHVNWREEEVDWRFDRTSLTLLKWNKWFQDDEDRESPEERTPPPYLGDGGSVVVSESSGIVMVEILVQKGDRRLASFDLKPYFPKIWAIPDFARHEMSVRQCKLRVLTEDCSVHELSM